MREPKNQMLGTMEPPLMQLSVNIHESMVIITGFFHKNVRNHIIMALFILSFIWKMYDLIQFSKTYFDKQKGIITPPPCARTGVKSRLGTYWP